ncbi:MAG: hypothetical protein KDB29_08485 [Planctomycetes bacterium]|nr:hypothetical protein [Planctomycetota bacterium]
MNWFLIAACALLVAPLAAQQQPTAAEMAFIYELNRARSNPQNYDTENSLGGILNGVAAQPPLALNLNLVQSARFHSAEMGANGYFGHQSTVTNDWPNKMARDAGYVLPTSWSDTTNNIESIAAYGSSGSGASYSAPDALKALIIDANTPSLGHRIHLLAMNSFNQNFREIGTGYGTGLGWTAGVNTAAYWSIHTGRHNTLETWLTGVVYNDANSNGRYDEGEGLQGVTVTAVGATSPSTSTTVGGGWSILAPAGTWNLTCTGGPFSGTSTASVTVSSANIAVDFESGTATGEVNFGNQIVTPPSGGSSGDSGDEGGGGGCVAEATSSSKVLLLLVMALFGVMTLLHRRVYAQGSC